VKQVDGLGRSALDLVEIITRPAARVGGQEAAQAMKVRAPAATRLASARRSRLGNG